MDHGCDIGMCSRKCTSSNSFGFSAHNRFLFIGLDLFAVDCVEEKNCHSHNHPNNNNSVIGCLLVKTLQFSG
jgi:hypothetical protein